MTALMGTSLLTTCGYSYHIAFHNSDLVLEAQQPLVTNRPGSSAMWESEDWHIAAGGDKLKWQNTSKDP